MPGVFVSGMNQQLSERRTFQHPSHEIKLASQAYL